MAFRTLFLFIVVATTVGVAAAVPVPTWCIADWDNAATMKNGQNWACVEGGVDCSPIQPPIGLCFHPNSTLFHASFAYNAYYHMQTGAPGSCYFNGIAIVTANDPSYDVLVSIHRHIFN